MLALEHLHCRPASAHAPLLDRVSLAFPRGHLAAIVGPSGSGKSTLLRAVAGSLELDEGHIRWHGRDLATEGDLPPGEIGYVPQFSIAHERLSVRDNLLLSAALRMGNIAPPERRAHVDAWIHNLELDACQSRPVRHLSGGERRRLALALEMLSEPSLLLCDEVTSGLDLRAEDQIMALLHGLSRQHGRIVLAVTHSFRHVALFDSVTVMVQGRVAFFGPPEALLDTFGVTSFDEIFPRLAEQPDAFPAPSESLDAWTASLVSHEADAWDRDPIVPAHPLSQTLTLLKRRLLLFVSDRGQLLGQTILALVFPVIVVLFAWDGLPEIRNVTMGPQIPFVEQLRDTIPFVRQAGEVGSLVSGLIMFQVILLTLMGSNNAAREIAGARLLLEKEKLAGLSVGAFILSTGLFLACLVSVQTFAMVSIVKNVCGIPGSFGAQFVLLFLVNAAMTAVCLGLSAWCRSSHQASLISVYLVGFQLPLSGAVLAMPDVIGGAIRPAIAAYWGWAGMIQTLRDSQSQFYDLVREISNTPLAAPPVCVWVLAAHVVLGTVLATLGSARSTWDADPPA